jgi:hypothetical protein
MRMYEAINLSVNGAMSVAFAYACYVMLSGGVYAYIVLPPIASFHAWTAVSLIAAFFIGEHRLRFLPVPLRQIYAYTLMIAGMYLYEATYAVFAFATGHRYSVFPFLCFFIALALIIYLDHKNLFFEPTRINWFALGVLMLCYVALTVSGFFDVVLAYETVGGPDPNVNPLWLLSKFAGLMVFPFATLSGGENCEVRITLDDAR